MSTSPSTGYQLRRHDDSLYAQYMWKSLVCIGPKRNAFVFRKHNKVHEEK